MTGRPADGLTAGTASGVTAGTADGRLRGAVREFLAGQAVTPHCDAWMSQFDPAFSRALAQRGWIGMTWPARYGGAEAAERDRLAHHRPRGVDQPRGPGARPAGAGPHLAP